MVTFGVPEKAVSLAFTYSETWNDLVTLRTYSRCLHALVFALHSNYPLFQWYHRRTVYFREKCGCRTNYDIYWHILCRHSSNVFCYSSKGNFDFCGNILPPWSMLVVCCKEKAGFYQQKFRNTGKSFGSWLLSYCITSHTIHLSQFVGEKHRGFFFQKKKSFFWKTPHPPTLVLAISYFDCFCLVCLLEQIRT